MKMAGGEKHHGRLELCSEWKRFNLALVALVLFCGALVPILFSTTAPLASAYTSHVTISIDGNVALAAAAAASGGGTGTFSDPYIIENYAINASSADGIYIAHTTAYFVVRNCLVENGGASKFGIYLHTAINGRIENNICFNNYEGIYLEVSSNYDNLENNTCDNNDDTGICLDASSYVRVTGNVCENNAFGIYVWNASSYDNIDNNNCSNNLTSGIYIEASPYDNFTRNTCENNVSYGIHLGSTYDNLISNVCRGNLNSGIYTMNASFNRLVTNNFYGNVNRGVYLDTASDNNTISGNTFENNSLAIYLNISSSDNLTGNICTKNTCGFGIEGTTISHFDHNIDNLNLVNGKPVCYLKDNSDLVLNQDNNIGWLGLVRCDNIRVENLVLENNYQNILLASTENSRIENCILSRGNYGIYLFSSLYDNIKGNTCLYSSYGIYLKSSSSDNLINNIANTNTWGIYLSSSSSNILTGNVMSNNENDIYNTGSTDNYSLNQFNNNIFSKMLTFVENTRIKNVGDTVNFSVSTYNLNGTNLSGCVVTTTPSEASLSYSGTNTVTGSFIPTKSGTYSLNFTITDENVNTTTRRMLYLVGTTASTTTKYYLRGISPTHGQMFGNGHDSKTLLLAAPTGTRMWWCAGWVQNSPDTIPNYPLANLTAIDIYTWYKQSSAANGRIGVQRYITYDSEMDNLSAVGAATVYTWVNNNFAENWATDYPQSWYWLATKLRGTNPYQTTFPAGHLVSEASYVDFTYSVTTTPVIKSISDPDNIVLVSATEPVSDEDNATIVLYGTGSTNIVLDNFNRPFIGYTTTINSDNTATIAANGLTGTTTINSVAMDITPSSGSIDVSINNWENSGTYYKKWTENGSSSGITAIHTIDNLKANENYDVRVNGVIFGTYKSDSSGQITFTYNGGYSTKTFEVMTSIAHAPIAITSNASFKIGENGVTSGSGTSTDPWIIENWVISASGAHGIYITATTEYFVVRNCLIENGGSTYYGIYLKTATNGRVENNICENNKNGINLWSNYDNITNNICRNNTDYGINLNSSSYDNLINNISDNNEDYGIYLQTSSFDNFIGNTCSGNLYGFGNFGASISHFDHNIDKTNLINNKPMYYLKDNSDLVLNQDNVIGYLGLVRCDNITVENLIFENNETGIVLATTINSRIENCIFSKNIYGITLRVSSNYNNIIGNICENNYSSGIYLATSSYDNFTSNTCERNRTYGIYLSSLSENNNLTSNTCKNNGTAGINIVSSSYENLTGNITNSTGRGIYLQFSSYDNVTNNTTTSNNYGIYLLSSSSTVLSGNVISNNTNDIYNTGSTTNTYSLNQSNNNIISKMITFVENATVNTTRSYNVNDTITFKASVFNLYGAQYGNHTTVTVSPDETSLNPVDNGTGGITVTFTPTKSGTYSLTFTVTDENSNVTKRSVLFFVGATASTTTKYYFRKIHPTHGQPWEASLVDSETLYLTAPSTSEEWWCTQWVQNSPDEIPNYPLANLTDIDIYTWYRATSGAYIGVQRYFTYSSGYDNRQSIGAVADYTWINENFDNNWAMDYPQSWYWIALKLYGNECSPYQATFPATGGYTADNASYANFTRSFTMTPVIKSISNPDNIVLVSATEPVGDEDNATIVLNGTGSTNIVLENFNRPFIGYTTTINSDNTATIAANGLTGTTTINSVAMDITPSSGSIDVSIDNWENSGTYYKKWTENGNAVGTAIHTIDNLKANTYYDVKVNGVVDNTRLSNSSGQITFTYNGGYSIKTFEIEELPAAWQLVETWTGTVTTTAAWQLIDSWTGTVSASVSAPGQPTLYLPADGENTNDNTPYFEWENGTGADNHRLVVDNDSDFSSPKENWVILADNKYTIAAENSLPDNLYYWKVAAVNATCENWSSVRTFRVDTLTPAVPTITAPADGENTNDNTPTITWNVVSENSLPVLYQVIIDNNSDFSLPENDSGWISATSYTPSALIDNLYYLRVRAKDNAGNVGENMQRTFHVDATAPTVTTFSIDAGVTYALSTSVTLTITANDVGSGVDSMCFSNDGSSWSGWETYSPSKSWSLSSGDGTKTVYAKVRDTAGNVSAVASDSIILNTTPGSVVSSASVPALPPGEVVKIAVVTSSGANVIIAPVDEGAVPAPSGYTVFAYFSISAPTQTSATITFGVSTSWLESHGIDQVILLMYVDGVWQPLPTSYTMSDGVYSYYSATTPWLSVFAVAWVANPVQPPTVSSQEPTNLLLNVIIIVGIGAIILFMIILIAPVVKKKPS